MLSANEPFKKILINSLTELDSFAADVAAWITKLDTPIKVGVEGDLGAGKTTLIGLIGKHLGIFEQMSSPSYVLEHQYLCPSGLLLRHWDLYRIVSGVCPEELLQQENAKQLFLIEWASKCPELIPELNYKISINILEENTRSIVLLRG